MHFKRLKPNATLPTYASNEAAGLDLYYSGDEYELFPGDYHAFATGIACAIPKGFYGRIEPRSGLAVRHGIDVLAGTIDSDYRGELVVVLINHGHRQWKVTEGMRIAQMVIKPYERVKPTWVNELCSTSRGGGGFGSTGD